MKEVIRCAYCGIPVGRSERDHVVPSCLYPASKARSSVQRITVPACRTCNGGWSDDEAHFRNVLLVAGDPNYAVTELWNGPTRRSFYEQADGRRRLRDLYEQMRRVETSGGPRWMIYPARDERIVRIIRKVIRGLSHYHEIESAVADERIWADVLKFTIPDEVIQSVTFKHCERDIFQYWYEAYETGELRSLWYLTFFERRTFIGSVQPRE